MRNGVLFKWERLDLIFSQWEVFNLKEEIERINKGTGKIALGGGDSLQLRLGRLTFC